MLTVSYTSTFDREYAIGLRHCQSLARLVEFAEFWGSLAPDAAAVVGRMTESDFRSFRKGLMSESKGEYAGDDWSTRYGAVLMPELLFRVSIIGAEFGAPWGTAFIRLREIGAIQQRGDVWVWVAPQKGADDAR